MLCTENARSLPKKRVISFLENNQHGVFRHPVRQVFAILIEKAMDRLGIGPRPAQVEIRRVSPDPARPRGATKSRANVTDSPSSTRRLYVVMYHPPFDAAVTRRTHTYCVRVRTTGALRPRISFGVMQRPQFSFRPRLWMRGRCLNCERGSGRQLQRRYAATVDENRRQSKATSRLHSRSWGRYDLP